jgi:acylphosphatase
MNMCYIVKGMVQGVGFRYTVYRLINREYPSVKGYVKNLHDGTVRICLDSDVYSTDDIIFAIKNVIFSGYIREINNDGCFLSGQYNGFMIE